MNRNVVYLAVFGVLCALAGVLVGAGIARKANMPWPGPRPERPNFAEKAERFMGYGPRGPAERRGGGGPIDMLTIELGLSAEQKAKVTEILEKTRQEIDTIGKSIRSAITQIKEKGDKQIMDILTPQQQEKFKALQKELEMLCGPKGPEGGREPMREHRPRPDEDFPPQG